ncbi:hypothetical protein C7C46_20485, partial [Streptomyces tateyamensis]
QETLTVAQLADLANNASSRAGEQAAVAKDAAAKAVDAARLAKEAAQKAAQETQAAQGSASKAANAAGRAADAASRAAVAAKTASSAAAAANAAAEQAANAAAAAAQASTQAGDAAAKARDAAAAAANDKAQADAATQAAVQARQAAADSRTAGEAAAWAGKVAVDAGLAASSAAQAGADAAAAAQAAADAAGYSGVADAQAQAARDAAAVAKAAAVEAQRAANATVKIAGEAAAAAGDAQRAANDAAGHADAAAAAADAAAAHAGEAATAANTAQAAATEAKAAADTADAAGKQAHNVAKVAADADAERLAEQQAANIASADQASRDAATKQKIAAWQSGQAAQLAADTQQLFKDATASGVDPTVAVVKGRQLAVRLMTSGGPWTKAAAEAALDGTDADVQAFLGGGLSLAQERDDRVSAQAIAKQSTNLEQRLAAERASVAPAADLRQFLVTGQYPGKDDDDRVALSQIMAAGGPGVKAAANAALNGTIDDVRAFLTTGQYKARNDDNRVLITQDITNGGPEVKAAAQAAMSGPDSGLETFLNVGLPKAQQRDMDTAAHVAVINSYLSKIDGSVATARQYAAEAAASAATARGAANEAAAAAQQAQQSAQQASDAAKAAAASAAAAQQSAAQAAAYAKQALAAAASAQSASQRADASTIAATQSAAQARQYAADAQAAADAAKASALAAGKSAADAQAASTAAQGEIWKQRQASNVDGTYLPDTVVVDDDGRVSAVFSRQEGDVSQEVIHDDISSCVRDDNLDVWLWLFDGHSSWHKDANGQDVCDVPVKVQLHGTMDYELKTCPVPNLSIADCQGQYTSADVTPLRTVKLDDIKPYDDKAPMTYDFYAQHYKMYCSPDGGCSNGDSAKILWQILTGDIVKCWNNPGINASCFWAVATVVPAGTLFKGAKAVIGLKIALETGVAISDAMAVVNATSDAISITAAAKLQNLVSNVAKFRATLKTGVGTDEALNVLRQDATVDRYLVDELGNEQEVAAEARESCLINSFPSSTEVLLADGSHKPISQIRVGDQVLATDPATGAEQVEPVTAAFSHSTERLVEIGLADGGTLSSTAGHRLYVDGAGWQVASSLHVGDHLRSADGSLRTITSLHDHTGLAPQTVYDLTVGALHTFYVRTTGDRPQDLLVHNCVDIVKDEGGPDGAHTLDEHVNKTPAQAQAKAEAERNGKATIWNDQATAAKSVSDAFQAWVQDPENQLTLANWKTKQAQRIGKGGIFISSRDLLTVRWELRGRGSLGRVYTKGNPSDGSVSDPTGSVVVIQLKYVGKPHPERFVVYTSYPE